MNNQFGINSNQNYNSHEGVIINQKYPSLNESDKDMQEAIDDRKSHNYQSFMNDTADQVVNGSKSSSSNNL